MPGGVSDNSQVLNEIDSGSIPDGDMNHNHVLMDVITEVMSPLCRSYC